MFKQLNEQFRKNPKKSSNRNICQTLKFSKFNDINYKLTLTNAKTTVGIDLPVFSDFQ